MTWRATDVVKKDLRTIAVTVDGKLHEPLRVKLAKQNRTFQDLVPELLRLWLSGKPATAPSPTPQASASGNFPDRLEEILANRNIWWNNFQPEYYELPAAISEALANRGDDVVDMLDFALKYSEIRDRRTNAPIAPVHSSLNHPNVPDEPTDVRYVRLKTLEILSGYQRIVEHAQAEWQAHIRETVLPVFEQNRRVHLAKLAYRIRIEYRLKRALHSECDAWSRMLSIYLWSLRAWSLWSFLAFTTLPFLRANWRIRSQVYCLQHASMLLAPGY